MRSEPPDPDDAPKFKDYLLPLLFLKRLSDVFDDEIARLAEDYDDRETALEIAEGDHSLLRFYLPPEARWAVISGREAFSWPDVDKPKDIGEHLTKAVRAVVKQNPRLSGVLDVVDFAAERNGERDVNPAKLRLVVETFSDPRYRLGLADVQPDFLGRAYEYLLRKFAEGSGQSAGEFFTPTEVGFLMAHIMRPRPGEACHDYACGSAGLLVKLQLVARELDPTSRVPLKLTGQELQAESYAVAQMNGIIHDMEIEIARGDTMINPKFTEEREEDVRLLFKKADKEPRILIVTDKLLTGYDAPLLYCLYLDKPMRDHVLLQAIARVNRPYVDKEGVAKQVGLIIDFVGVLRELKKALKFDSDDVAGAIEDLDLLLADFKTKIGKAEADYLDAGEGGDADERLERVIYGRFLEPEPRKAFFEAYKDIEDLWEILSPSKDLVDHISSFKRLAQLYAAVRNAYADKVGFVADLAYKTRRLVEQNATQEGLGSLTKSVTFDVKTLEALRSEKGSPEGKVFNLVRGLQKDIDDDADTAPVLQPLKDRAERILKDLESRNTTGLAAMDLLAALAAEKEAATQAAKDSGLTPKAFAVFWRLREEAAIKSSGIDPMELAREIEKLLLRFPNARVTACQRGRRSCRYLRQARGRVAGLWPSRSRNREKAARRRQSAAVLAEHDKAQVVVRSGRPQRLPFPTAPPPDAASPFAQPHSHSG